jgi:hypothetical protein
MLRRLRAWLGRLRARFATAPETHASREDEVWRKSSPPPPGGGIDPPTGF